MKTPVAQVCLKQSALDHTWAQTQLVVDPSFPPCLQLYRVSPLLFVGVASPALISGTGEVSQELLCSNKPVILFQFGLIWFTVLAEKPIMGEGAENLLHLISGLISVQQIH